MEILCILNFFNINLQPYYFLASTYSTIITVFWISCDSLNRGIYVFLARRIFNDYSKFFNNNFIL